MLLEKTIERFSKGEKIVWGATSVLAWWHGLHFFALSWGPVFSVLMSMISGVGVSVGSAVAMDYYKEHWKHKLFKHKHGKSKENDNQRAA